jgi:hypothetical protein
MKTKFWTAACILGITLASASPASASEDSSFEIIADTIVVRPACLVATVVGSAFFVISLPFSAASKSVKKTANTLVVKPARATFTRPLGDMDSLLD